MSCDQRSLQTSARACSAAAKRPETVVVVVSRIVVVVSSRVELVVVLVLVPDPQGHWSVIDCPTAFCRHTSASVAEIGNSPLGAQMHCGVQVSIYTAALRMKRQSVAVGAGPLLKG